MITTLASILIAALSLTEVYCIARLIQYAIDRSEQRTEQRRAMYRAQAYKQMNERWSMNQKRRALWRWIEK